jgi:CubicO group peptidase (beta-lactamase class C family)
LLLIWLKGKNSASGKLPVRVCNFTAGFGIDVAAVEKTNPSMKKIWMAQTIDSIVTDAISQKAFPGCVILAVKDGEIIYDKAFGSYAIDKPQPVTLESIFDLASVTKFQPRLFLS